MSGGCDALRSVPPSPVERTLGALPELLDPEVGLIQSIRWPALRHDEPRLRHCEATLADVGRVTGRSSNRYTGGTALDDDDALAKTIGEAVERYCGDLYDADEVVYASHAELRSKAIDPRRFVLFHPEQYESADFPFVPVSGQSVIGWVPAFSLTRGEHTLVPATLVHVPYDAQTPDEGFEIGPVSGYACGNTLEEAILGGILEVVERDAFMIFWYNWLPVPAIDPGSGSSRDLARALDAYGAVPARIFCSDITTDVGIPAAVALMTSRREGRPAAAVATAADLDPERALTRALLELAANERFVRSLMEAGAEIPRGTGDVESPEDHGLLFARPDMLPCLEPLTRPRTSLPLGRLASRASGDVKRDIETCIGLLAGAALEVIAVDLTSADMEDLGFKVVKVLIPGMQPLDFGSVGQHLGGRRLFDVPRRLGYREAATRPSELNRFPHPFP